ncbi:hypothetical protein L7F22_030486 [Adiantum nelumboides]|nr:hypothetical protein [Adiantum nelumboides]
MPEMAEGFAERPSTATQYFSQDFKWEDLRDEVYSQTKASADVPYNSQVVSLDCNVEAWSKFHQLHAKHAFFKTQGDYSSDTGIAIMADRNDDVTEEVSSSQGQQTHEVGESSRPPQTEDEIFRTQLVTTVAMFTQVMQNPRFMAFLQPLPLSQSIGNKKSEPAKAQPQERRYLVKEFPDLLASERVLNILEIGCGTGSSVLPILRANKAAVVYACDCSESVLKRAHSLALSTISSDGNRRFVPFLCDVSMQRLPSWLCCSSCTDLEDNIHTDSIPWENDEQLHCISGIDITTMVFTLSSIPPYRMQHVLKECFSVLKPGGLVLFRDYGLYDMTMQRFSATQRVGEQLYQRGDGTLAYFFTPELLSNLFTEAGFIEIENYFCCVELRNRRRELPMKRVWIHAKFMKPHSPSLHP